MEQAAVNKFALTATPSSARPRSPAEQARPCAPVLAPQRRAAAALGAAALVLSAPWAPALAADLKLGRQVFEQNCAVCHAGGLNSIAGEEKHTLKRDALERYNLYSVEGIATQVHFLGLDKVITGKDAMPPFKPVLTEQEIRAVAEFVFDQAAGDKW